MKRFLACCLLAIWPALAQPTLFEQANQLLEQKRYKEALPLYKKAIVETPNVSVLWNLAITAQYCEDWPEALKAWTHMRFEEPDNWKVRAKLIQVYQGMGQKQKRDAERAQLFQYRKANPKIANEPAFCRDQFRLGDDYVLAFEQFEFTGERKVRYRFVITDPVTEATRYVISLGSYDSTTEIARAGGDLKPNERLYHLDYYQGPNHATYAMVTKEPDYDETRQMVVEILTGKRRPRSSSGPPPP